MRRVLTFGMYYHLVERYQVQIMPLWPKLARPRAHIFNVGLYKESIKIFSDNLDIWYVASPSGTWPSLFK